MPNISLTAPTDWQAQQEDILRRRKMAEMLQQQSSQPVERFSTNGIEAPVSWTQGLAKLLQGYMGGKQQRDLTEEQRKLGQDYQTSGQDALVRGLRALQGSPERPAQMDPQEIQQSQDQGTPLPQNIPAQAPDRMAAMGAFASHPMTQGASTQVLAELLKSPESQFAKIDPQHFTPESIAKFTKTGRHADLVPSVSPNTLYTQGEENKRYGGVSGNTQAQIGSAQQLHQIPSGSAQLGAQTSMRGQNIGASTALAGQNVTMRGQNMTDVRDRELAAAKGPNENQGKANLYQSRAVEAATVIDALQGQYSPAAIATKQGAGKVWGVGGALEAGANTMMPKKTQMVEQAQRNFVNAILRQESGSAIAESEFANAQKQYFPQPGDAPAVIAQKKQNRDTAIAGLQVMAGPAMKRRASDSTQTRVVDW